MKLLFFILCALVIAQNLYAQSSDSLLIKRYYEENTIFWPGINRKYYKNNKAFPFKNLKTEYSFSKEAALEYSYFKTNQRRFWLSYPAGFVMVVGSIAAKDQRAKVGLLGLSIVTFGFSIRFNLKSTYHLTRSLWVHNRDVLLR